MLIETVVKMIGAGGAVQLKVIGEAVAFALGILPLQTQENQRNSEVTAAGAVICDRGLHFSAASS